MCVQFKHLRFRTGWGHCIDLTLFKIVQYYHSVVTNQIGTKLKVNLPVMCPSDSCDQREYGSYDASPPCFFFCVWKICRFCGQLKVKKLQPDVNNMAACEINLVFDRLWLMSSTYEFNFSMCESR